MTRREIKSEITGSLWKIVKQPGESVTEDDPLMILESMKMEIPIMADAKGTVLEIMMSEGDPVAEGQVVAILEV